MRTRTTIVCLSVLFALLTLVPYWLAASSAGQFRFTGFLFNPLDAASYLAKMRQGWEGNWLYTLAFTDTPGPGALLFTYYLLLGHLANWLGVSLVAAYHAARVGGATIFLITAWWAFDRLGLTKRARVIAWVSVMLGSGFGWMAALAGYAASDLWVAEFIPFLGMLTSAHFPLAMAILLVITVMVVAPDPQHIVLRHLAVLFASIAEAILQPFALIPLALAFAIWICWRRLRMHHFPAHVVTLLVALIAGATPFALYDFWVTHSLPAFASWSAQNQTPAPPVWDIALGFGPLGLVLLIALFGWIHKKRSPFSASAPEKAIESPQNGSNFFLMLWLASVIGLMYLPIPLQRRMMLGAMLPVSILAAPHIERWLFAPAFQPRRLLMAFLILPLSNLIVLVAMARAIQTRAAPFFLTADQSVAMDWLATHAAPGDVVLAPPDLSLWIPGFTGQRVVYGHPMETPNADAALLEVKAFYGGSPFMLAVLHDHSIRWVYCQEANNPCPNPFLSSTWEVWRGERDQLLQVRNDP